MRVRRGVAADAPALAAFGARTFIEAFGADNTPEDVAAFLAKTFGPDIQEREITNPDSITLLMDGDHGLAAYAQVRRQPAPACVTGPKPIEIQRFYVDRPWHGRGVAQQLMQAAHDAAAELGGATIWLGTWERNQRGRAFYAKVGFADVGTVNFYVGSDRQTDHIFMMPVRASAK
ncbi:MAG TPA: GNAT family N-acetyltransferase [Gemmatimonadaceae bacterium]